MVRSRASFAAILILVGCSAVPSPSAAPAAPSPSVAPTAIA